MEIPLFTKAIQVVAEVRVIIGIMAVNAEQTNANWNMVFLGSFITNKMQLTYRTPTATPSGTMRSNTNISTTAMNGDKEGLMNFLPFFIGSTLLL
jgi:hypothetical protein